MHRPRAYHSAEEQPRPRVFPTVDMSHWSPNTDLGVSLQRAIYISLSICQPVSALVSLSPSLSLPHPLWGCQSLFHTLSLSLCLYPAFPQISVALSLFSGSLPQAGLFSHSLLLPHSLRCSAPPTLGGGSRVGVAGDLPFPVQANVSAEPFTICYLVMGTAACGVANFSFIALLGLFVGFLFSFFFLFFFLGGVLFLAQESTSVLSIYLDLFLSHRSFWLSLGSGNT